MQSCRSTSRTALLLCLIFSAPLAPGARAEVDKEYQLKAAFLYNFAKFVEWPAPALSGPAAPLVVAVVGKNPFGDELLKSVRGRRIDGHAIMVKFAVDPAAAKGANIIFVSAGLARRMPELNRLFGSGVLIVGDSPDAMGQGATIAFKLEGDRLRFEIDMAEAARDGLRISAQLQKLASRIHR